MRIDHVTIAGSDLRAMEREYAAIGLPFAYGGAHSNGVTHMSLLGFPDGSYIELISTIKPGAASPWWDAAIRLNAGPCAWAIEVADVAVEAARLAQLGVPVGGPHHMTRARPDGRVIEWDLAFPGAGEAGSRLPFIIKDRTPREWRVQPTPGIDAALIGITDVILAVRDLDAAVSLYRDVFELPRPVRVDHEPFDAALACFAGSPVTLAAPLGSSGWLHDRLELIDEAPCAYLLGSPHDQPWFERDVQWIDVAARLGVVS